MSEKATRIRFSVTITKAYGDALDYLVGEGIYLSRGEIVLEALRSLLRRHGIAPFAAKGEAPKEDDMDR